MGRTDEGHSPKGDRQPGAVERAAADLQKLCASVASTPLPAAFGLVAITATFAAAAAAAAAGVRWGWQILGAVVLSVPVAYAVGTTVGCVLVDVRTRAEVRRLLRRHGPGTFAAAVAAAVLSCDDPASSSDPFAPTGRLLRADPMLTRQLAAVAQRHAPMSAGAQLLANDVRLAIAPDSDIQELVTLVEHRGAGADVAAACAQVDEAGPGACAVLGGLINGWELGFAELAASAVLLGSPQRAAATDNTWPVASV